MYVWLKVIVIMEKRFINIYSTVKWLQENYTICFNTGSLKVKLWQETDVKHTSRVKQQIKLSHHKELTQPMLKDNKSNLKMITPYLKPRGNIQLESKKGLNPVFVLIFMCVLGMRHI